MLVLISLWHRKSMRRGANAEAKPQTFHTTKRSIEQAKPDMSGGGDPQGHSLAKVVPLHSLPPAVFLRFAIASTLLLLLLRPARGRVMLVFYV